MGALRRLPVARGVEVMQAINVFVINRSFMSVFLGTAFLCCALSIAACVRWQDDADRLLLLGSLFYLVGTIGVTMIFNVPLNNALAAVRPDTPERPSLWAHYLRRWTMWNTLRIVSSTAAMVLFVAALR